MWIPFPCPLRKFVLYPVKFWWLLLKQAVNVIKELFLKFRFCLTLIQKQYVIHSNLPHIPWIVMFLGFTNTKIRNNRNLLPLINRLLLFYQRLPCWVKFLSSPCHFFEKINKTPNLINIVEEIQLLLIKTTFFTSIC